MGETREKSVIFLVFVLLFLSQIANSSRSVKSTVAAAATPLPGSSKHFVLVHGAGHGAWCWYKLVDLLRLSGHNVTAFDLAASGIDPNQEKQVRLISDYFRPLTNFMATLSRHDKVVLVAHSYGGLAVSYAMEMFPKKISAAVFVSALMPGPSLNISTFDQEFNKVLGNLMDTRYAYDDGPNQPPTAFTLGPLYLAQSLYQLSPSEDLALANSLVRPHRLFQEEDKSRALNLSNERYGSVSRAYIMPSDDKSLPVHFQRWMIKRNPPHQVVVIQGADHMVMMSKPVELFVHLQAVGRKLS